MIVSEVVQKPMWLGCFRQEKSQCRDCFWSCLKTNVIELLSLRQKPMLWLFLKLFGDQYDWVAFAKMKANIVIVYEVVWKPMWLGFFHQKESQRCDCFRRCSKINVIGLLWLRWKPMLWLFLKPMWLDFLGKCKSQC